jgi:2-polyprenyl-3-methyl-5-hydroxy-6-metoxy-1,4-benzoquinol methylase
MWLEPLPNEDELRKHYATRSANGNYDLNISRERDESIAETLDFIVQQTGARPHLRLMDVGCFDGKLLDLARERLAWDCWGIELNPQAAEAAKERHGERVACMTVEQYDPPHGVKFDVVTAVAVIEHLREPQRLLSKVADWLVDGGVCILELPNAASLPARMLGRYWPAIAAPEHIWYFAPRHIARLAENVGLRFVKSERHWKKLSIRYIHDQLQFFGPEIRKFSDVIMKLLPSKMHKKQLHVYGGEIYVVMRKD